MQLTKINNTLKPLTLAVGLVSVAPLFTYADIDNVSPIINSQKTIEYMNIVDNAENFQLSNKFRFQMHLKNWEKKTKLISSVASIVGDEDFKTIVSMGEYAVPFIKEELQRKPSTLVWALNYIRGKKISNNPHLTISEACKLWIKEI